jgi:hypothetical protein|tara:strand:+ start:4182 stop:4367 length:186 start_codon:yes stop_codon:yes gene_type:complete
MMKALSTMWSTLEMLFLGVHSFAEAFKETGDIVLGEVQELSAQQQRDHAAKLQADISALNA